MNKKENYIKIPLHNLHSINVLLSRLYRDDPFLKKDIDLLLYFIYQDWNKVDETIKRWKEEMEQD